MSCGRGLAVERAAAMVEQLRLLGEGRVAVHLEQPRLDVHDVLGARVAVPLLREDGVRSGSSSAGSRTGSRRSRPNQVRPAARRRSAIRSASSVEQLRQPVDAVHADGPLPAQVVEPDVLELDPLRLDAEPAGQPALDADRHVAQPERAVAVVDERLGDDPDRVREVDDPGVLGGAPRRSARRARGRRARSAAPWRSRRRPVVSWPITPNVERQRLVDEPRGLAADAQLDEHEVGAVERGVAVAGEGQPAGPAEPVEHPLGQAADDREPLGVDVEQDELVDRAGGRRGGRSPRRARACTCCRRRRPRP